MRALSQRSTSCPRLVRALVASLALVLVAGCAGLGISSGSDHAGRPPTTRLAHILDTGTLRVGMSGEQPPLNMTSRTGELVGLEVALARVLAATIGVQLELVRIPFPRLLDALEAGEIDLIMSGMTITAQRNLRVVFVGPYFLSGQSLLSRSTELLAAALDELNRPERASSPRSRRPPARPGRAARCRRRRSRRRTASTPASSS